MTDRCQSPNEEWEDLNPLGPGVPPLDVDPAHAAAALPKPVHNLDQHLE